MRADNGVPPAIGSGSGRVRTERGELVRTASLQYAYRPSALVLGVLAYVPSLASSPGGCPPTPSSTSTSTRAG